MGYGARLPQRFDKVIRSCRIGINLIIIISTNYLARKNMDKREACHNMKRPVAASKFSWAGDEHREEGKMMKNLIWGSASKRVHINPRVK